MCQYDRRICECVNMIGGFVCVNMIGGFVSVSI